MAPAASLLRLALSVERVAIRPKTGRRLPSTRARSRRSPRPLSPRPCGPRGRISEYGGCSRRCCKFGTQRAHIPGGRCRVTMKAMSPVGTPSSASYNWGNSGSSTCMPVFLQSMTLPLTSTASGNLDRLGQGASFIVSSRQRVIVGSSPRFAEAPQVAGHIFKIDAIGVVGFSHPGGPAHVLQACLRCTNSDASN